MKYCLKKKEKFVTIKCGNGVQLAYSKKYTPAAVISFLQLRNYHVADCILHQKMTNIELWGSLEEGHPKKASYKLIHPDFIEWWRKVQKSGGAEPAIPPIFYEGVKPVALKSEPKGKNSDVEDLEIMVEEPVELAESDEFTFDDGAGISSANITGKNSMVNKCNNVGVVAKSSGYRRDNVRPDRPSQLVRLRTGGENNSVPAHLGMKSSPDVSEECKKKSVNVQTVIGAANFADAGEPIGMSDSIELVANKEVSGDDLRSDYINVDEVLESLYNIDERIELQEKSVYNRSIIVSKAI